MYSRFRVAAKYLQYYLTASNGRGHGIHSPFVYEFVTKVLNDQRHFDAYDLIEQKKEEMLLDHRVLDLEDFGGGSVFSDADQRSLSEIARYASSTQKFGRLLYRIARFYEPVYMLELGTSLGISTAYLAFGNPDADLVTLEGSPAVAGAAATHFTSLGLTNIKTVTGNFDSVLGKELDALPAVDLAFVDGNHRKEPLLRYVESLLKKKSHRSVFILHDIHWSSEMEEAWERVKEHPESMLTIDLFFGGLIFFRNEFKVKQHFVIRA
jgi:predicted O-methyltransferase YrrM